MDYATRKKIYRKIEAERQTRVITFVTGDRPGMETQIAPDSVNIFVELLDEIGPTKKISLILHTNGGQTAAAWRIVNLIRTFCDELDPVEGDERRHVDFARSRSACYDEASRPRPD
jgi:ATP-dependent protease ClpP protease subunit